MPGIGVKQLDHVTLVVRDLEASREFYVDLLGMKEVPRPNFDFQGAWFQAGETWIHLILEHGESGQCGNLVGSGLTVSRTHHFAFVVEDACRAAKTLTAADYPIASGPKERPDGAVQVFVLDPDGYVVELSSPPKA